MDITNAQRARVLVHALPYIQDYSGKIVVVKYGGNAMISEHLKDSVIRDICLLQLIGVKVVLVHGGGPEITDVLGKMGKKSTFVDGVRVTDEEAVGVVLTWSGSAAPSKPDHPFNTSENFFDVLYNATFWTDGTLKNNQSFEFDSRCPESDYIPAIQQEIDELHKSLLQQTDCTWAYLGFKKNNKADQEKNCFLLWTSLDTNKVGGGKQIPVLIQTSAGKYYVSETTTDQRWRNGKKYVTVSKRMEDYKDLLSSDMEYPSLEDAYDAYIAALNNEKYDGVRGSSGQ